MLYFQNYFSRIVSKRKYRIDYSAAHRQLLATQNRIVRPAKGRVHDIIHGQRLLNAGVDRAKARAVSGRKFVVRRRTVYTKRVHR